MNNFGQFLYLYKIRTLLDLSRTIDGISKIIFLTRHKDSRKIKISFASLFY